MNNLNDKTEDIFELASILTEQNDFNEIIRVVSAKTSDIFNSEFASIVIINPRTQDTLKTIIKEKKNHKEEDYQIIQTIIIGWVMRNKQLFLSNNIECDKRFSKNLFENISVKSGMCVPLVFQNRNIGYITVINKSIGANYDKNSLNLLKRISDISAPHISNVQKLQAYFNVPLPKESLQYKYQQLGLIGQSSSFIELLRSIESAAKCDVRVVLEGETGTGKELVASAIHRLSNRSDHPFIAIDCGAIPQNLLESELFGHVKGAFTGANRDRKGLLEEANKGTLFMDEVNNLSMEIQSKLLRALQEGEVRPIGGNRKIKLDIRIIAASSLSLSELVDKDQFRRDLYFRLMVYPIYIPRLDERKGDIPILADLFLRKFSENQNKKLEYFHKNVIEYLKSKKWIGNVRELENFVERLVTLAPNNVKVLEASNLPKNYYEEINKYVSISKSTENISLKEVLYDYERKIIINSLEENNWNQNKVAKSLNVLEQTLRAKMKKLGISSDRKRNN